MADIIQFSRWREFSINGVECAYDRLKKTYCAVVDEELLEFCSEKEMRTMLKKICG